MDNLFYMLLFILVANNNFVFRNSCRMKEIQLPEKYVSRTWSPAYVFQIVVSLSNRSCFISSLPTQAQTVGWFTFTNKAGDSNIKSHINVSFNFFLVSSKTMYDHLWKMIAMSGDHFHEFCVSFSFMSKQSFLVFTCN
jgi:hypothetical protein